MRLLLTLLCLSLFTLAQQPNGNPPSASPKPPTATEELNLAVRRLEVAQATQQRAFIMVSQSDLSDCAKVLATVAELQKANQQVDFASQMVELKKKAAK